MIPTTATTPTQAQTVSSATLGLTSIILEGRPLSDNEFIVSNQILKICSKDDSKLPSRSNSNSLLRGNSAVASSSTYQQQYKVDSAETLHFKRLRQKLGQLRQSSPSTSRDYLVEQGIAIGTAKASNSNIDDDDDDELDQFVQSKSGSPSGSQVSESNFLSSLQSLATTCLRATPRSFTKSREVLGTSVDAAWSAATLPSSSPTKVFATSSSFPHHQLETSYRGTKLQAARGKAVPAKVGPHCDQFLKKIGCIKAEITEFELEHNCDLSNLNEICYRWQVQCRQVSTIISKTDPVCIEIYLGPENHEILLEQWIITPKEKLTTPTMTIQSLTNAIRSQLYFSQITAWIDLIKSYGDYNREILENSRVKKTKEGSRLDIIYRIRAYDSTACFQSKPNVHNFPDVVLAENCYISVCLKSLPRMQGGIPRVDELSVSFGTMQGGASAIMAVGGGNENLSEENMVLDDRMNLPCTEKGKHKCAFDEEESNSDAVGDVGASSSLSHREKQLMKYRKRMLKRDKKSKKPIESNQEESSSIDSTSLEKEHQNSNMCSSDSNSQQSLQEFASINSIRPPLYQTTTSVTESVQTNHVEMVSVSTQTASFPISFLNCDICGSEMHFVCWNCDRKFFQVEKPEKPEKPPQLGKGDLLLQAIQRTPLRAKYADHGNNNNSPGFRSIFKSDTNDCQLCKRQKTQHFFTSKEDRYKDYDENKYSNNNAENLSPSNCNGFNGESSPQRDTCHASHFGCNSNNSDNACDCFPRSNNSMPEREEVDMHNGHNITYEKNGHCAVENGNKSPCYATSSKDILEPTCDEIEAQFKTPKTYLSPKNQLKPTPLYINNSAEKQSTNISSKNRSNTNGSCNGKQLPKINLSNIFSNPPSPIQISSNDAFSFDNLSPEIPVQKSNSAPTLPNSPSLSPRFLKQAAIYKRRSRHLSDRSSERSSIGSDEQISDEDLESLNSPITSPLKARGLMKLNLFGRRPILGSLEESLLQKRFRPKCQLSGFKVLLGASGGFCPTQLSIPASAYFYELQGQSLSTPYMCEIRLSRKGYTVPRSGTVQATLLNPLGTVVRMFVIPYDFRDMPIMSQTFIRQRILAVDSTSNASNDVSMKDEACGISTFGEHVRSLRYAIHLRFQTSRSGRLALHTDIRFLISRRTDCDTAAAHAKGALESPNELKIITVIPDNPKYSTRQENPNKI